MGFRGWFRLNLEQAELAFAVFKTLAFVGAVAALFLAPVRPEHQVHLPPLLAFFLLYHLLLYGAAFRWRWAIRGILLAILACDLLFVFFLVWFTGGFESHFYLLFYLIITMSAYFFGFPIGLGSAVVSGLLYMGASFASHPEAVHLGHLSARIALFGLFGVSVGFLSERDRRYRAAVEQLNRELHQAYRELQAAQERLIQAERLSTIGKMSAKVAHEIRNPLSAIHLNAELLEDEIEHLQGASKEEASGLLASIKTQVQALAELTEEYLRFARMPEPKPQPEAINEIVADLVDFLVPESAERGIVIESRFAPDLPTVLVDRRQLRQALLNITRNAFEAMPDGGHLVIVTRRAGRGSPIAGPEKRKPNSRPPTMDAEFVEISVSDTGVGIPPESLGRIFEPFFTTKGEGTGLGLTIVRQIVEQQGGTIACQSVPGEGTTFTIRLPLSSGKGAS
ncbi:MAG: hypothetical protein HY347_05440 [candidate division NC10 bacterium]|nr:hypothetical protein [candidate division NC10 bacterium]